MSFRPQARHAQKIPDRDETKKPPKDPGAAKRSRRYRENQRKRQEALDRAMDGPAARHAPVMPASRVTSRKPSRAAAAPVTVDLSRMLAESRPPLPSGMVTRHDEPPADHAWGELVTAVLVLVVVGLGSFANWAVVAKPMVEMLGGAYVGAGFGAWKVGELCAAVVVAIEAFLGIEVVAAWRHGRRSRAGLALFLLLALTGIEIGTAYERETQRMDAVVQTCTSELLTEASERGEPPSTWPGHDELVGRCQKSHPVDWVSLWVQMGIGAVLPLALLLAGDRWDRLLGSVRVLRRARRERLKLRAGAR